MPRFGNDSHKASATLIAVLFAMGLLIGGLGTYYLDTRQISTLNTKVLDLQSQIATITGSQNQTVVNQTINLSQDGVNLPDLYANVSNSVVLVHGTVSGGEVQGSGFVYSYSGQAVVVTNFHVVYQASNVSVTFSNGHGYAASLQGKDPYADLAVLSVDAPASEFKPLEIVSSSALRVGDEVIAIGNPYGLVGSLTTGVVSALGRSIQEDEAYSMNFSIANIIQTSTPINPGNSGGPLLNAVGNVVGITTAIVSDSQGLGFAIPSNTILRELPSLIATGEYRSHSYLGIASTPDMADMTYDLAQQLDVNVTYGRYVGVVTGGGPSDGKLQAGDVIIALNSTTIRNSDDLGSYLEEKTLPGDVLVITVVRSNSTLPVDVTLGTRPLPNL